MRTKLQRVNKMLVVRSHLSHRQGPPSPDSDAAYGLPLCVLPAQVRLRQRRMEYDVRQGDDIQGKIQDIQGIFELGTEREV